MSECDCDAGNAANGWLEMRGPNCAKADHQVWRDVIARMLDPRCQYAIPLTYGGGHE